MTKLFYIPSVIPEYSSGIQYLLIFLDYRVPPEADRASLPAFGRPDNDKVGVS
ncbi:MAG: hypothetical protein Q7R62_03360 [bacterium]|nr:hypothetical protein [bacterium]